MYTQHKGKQIELTSVGLRALLHSNKLLFSDLKNQGVFLIWHLLTNNYAIRDVTFFKKEVYAIYLETTTIKCYRHLGYDGESEEAVLITKHLTVLNEFLNQELGISLFYFRVNSIAAVSMLLLKKYHPSLIQKFSPATEEFIRKSFYGGHCELYSPGTHYNVAYYDFPAMYGSLLAESFPKLYTEPTSIDKPFKKTDDLPVGFLRARVVVFASSALQTLPYPHADLGMIYPIGEFTGVY